MPTRRRSTPGGLPRRCFLAAASTSVVAGVTAARGAAQPPGEPARSFRVPAPAAD